MPKKIIRWSSFLQHLFPRFFSVTAIYFKMLRSTVCPIDNVSTSSTLTLSKTEEKENCFLLIEFADYGIMKS